jgi:nicotinamidase-related amidase
MAGETGLALEPSRTAVVIMDYQVGIVEGYAGDPEATVVRAAAVLRAARTAGIPVVHVRAGTPPYDVDEGPGRIRPEVAPLPGETVLTKTRTGAFTTTGLDVLLRRDGRDTVVLLGVATSGCVLTTVRGAADLGYGIVVVADACDDRDAEVHRVLTTKVYPRQATVVSAEAFAAALG